jgi:DNA-binding CsgD family transcriptional regulator/PAS domain-containing protein
MPNRQLRPQIQDVAAADGWPAIGSERFSDLVGAIYDCALRPDLWPATIAAVVEATHCLAGMIGVTDMRRMKMHALHTYGHPPGCIECMHRHLPDIVGLYRLIPDIPNLFDEPLSPHRQAPAAMLEELPYAREMRERFGIVDSIDLFLIADKDRVAEFGMSSQGYVSDEDLALMRLLAPHIRRAVTIGDLLDMKAIETQALGSALDGFAVGVVIVGDEGRILHANAAAQRMLANGSPIASNGGRLETLLPKTTGELLQAVAAAREDEAQIGKLGIGVPLVDNAMAAATAHVLPLARGDRRVRLMPQATAAVFVMPVDTPKPVDLRLVARMFSLTPAESRLLGHLATGSGIPETAARLGISEATAKTHRTRLFAKMGVARQTDLLAVLARLIPPLDRS